MKGMKKLGLIAVPAVLLMVGIMVSGCPKNLEHTTTPPNCQPVPLPPGSVGSWDNPVRCDMPPGEMAYLRRLRGPDGEPPRFMRTGNAGVGVNGNVVDRYVVQSQDGSVCVEVFMDMYYRGYEEDSPIEGFNIEF